MTSASGVRSFRPIPTGAAVLALTAVLAASPAAGSAAGDVCAEAAARAIAVLPDLVYEGRPDSLLAIVNAWEQACGFREPIVRIRILGSIWDGGFDEGLYDQRIIDGLLDARTPAAEDPPGRAAFDDFTRAFADQLLPHVPAGSPQEFFCLFYSGRSEAAWSLLGGEALAGTDLRRYYDRRSEERDRGGAGTFLAAGGGFWDPFAGYGFAGEHALISLQYGTEGRRWFARGIGEMRVGRTDVPYVAQGGGRRGMSDRFDALLLGLEVGRFLAVAAGHGVNAFAGLGLDVVQPFAGEDALLQALHLSAGAGYRFTPGGDRPWFLSLDYRREWTGARNREGAGIYGDAWSLRAAFGRHLGRQEPDRPDRPQG